MVIRNIGIESVLERVELLEKTFGLQEYVRVFLEADDVQNGYRSGAEKYVLASITDNVVLEFPSSLLDHGLTFLLVGSLEGK